MGPGAEGRGRCNHSPLLCSSFQVSLNCLPQVTQEQRWFSRGVKGIDEGLSRDVVMHSCDPSVLGMGWVVEIGESGSPCAS